MKTDMKLFPTGMVLAIVTLVISTAAQAGVVNGGGGKGVVCRNADSSITSVQLLDLWESNVIYNRPVKISTAPMFDQVAGAVQGLRYLIHSYQDNSAWFTHDLNATITMFKTQSASVRWLKGVTLTVTNDSFEAAKPNNCSIEQLVDYQDAAPEPIVLVNKDLYDKMDDTNRAALIVHESLYRFLRLRNDESDSIRTRRAVGYVFSGHEFPSMEKILPARRVECSSGISDSFTHYYFFEGSDHQVYAAADWFNGQYRLGFTSPVLTGIAALDQLLENTCDGDGLVKWGVPGNGPVDYDRTSYLESLCVSGQNSYYAVNKMVISPIDPLTSAKLFCQEVAP